MKTILITGAAGFIGSHLTDALLNANCKIIGIDNFDPFYSRQIKENNLKQAREHQYFTFYEADIRDKKHINEIFSVETIDVVVHLAAKAGVRPSIQNPSEYFDVNVDGTLNILEAMKNNGIQKLIYASSSSVYGNNPKVPFHEGDSVDHPISPYAASKKAGELLCHTYHHLYNFDIFCFRFFTVYGPRQRPDLAIHKFTDKMLLNEPIPVYGDGSSARDYTYIDDIIQGIMLGIQHIKGYEIINLGESETITLNSMLNTIEQELGIRASRNVLPMQAGDVDLTYADISKAKTLIGYHPRWDFKLGIAKFIEWKKK